MDDAKLASGKDQPDVWPPSASVQQKIEDQISCSVCLDIYREPRALPCFHVFCLRCLQATAGRLRPGDHFACPQCRKTAEVPKTGVVGLQVAFHVNNLIEIYESIQDAVKSPDAASPHQTSGLRRAPPPPCANCPDSAARYFCPQCSDFLCEDCRVVHGKWPRFSGHELSPVSEEMLSRREHSCKSHPTQPLTHYCKRCRQLVCSECLEESSNGCSHAQYKVSVTEASHLAKDAILTSLEPIHRQLTSIEGVISRIQAKKQHISEQATDVNSSITRDFDALLTALDRRQSELKDSVKTAEEGKGVGLSAQEENAEIAKIQLSNYLEGINHCLRKGSSVQVIRMQHVVEEKVKEILQEFGGLPQVPVEVANLHYFSSRELPSSIPSFGLVYSSNVVAADFYVSAEGHQWATACDEASITVLYTGKEAANDLLSQLTLRLSSEDSSNTALFETRREVSESSNRVVVNFIPIAKGKKRLHVTLCGHDVSNSPLDLTVMGTFRFTGTLTRCVGELRRPWGVSVSHTGQLAIVDNQGRHGLHLYGADSTRVHAFASVALPQIPEILISKDVCNEPRGVAFTGDGRMLLVDGKRHRVLCYDASGTLCSKAGSYGKGELQFNDPVGITVASSGQVLVCDRRNHRIQVLMADLRFVRQIGEFGEGDTESGTGLYLPWDVACDSEGQVYVADCGHFCVKVFTSDGRFLKKIGSEGKGRGHFKHISSVCIDSNDYLYALDKESACVSVFNPWGEVKMVFGTFGQLDGQFFKPHGIAVDGDGQVYVSDGESSLWPSPMQGRVQIFQ